VLDNRLVTTIVHVWHENGCSDSMSVQGILAVQFLAKFGTSVTAISSTTAGRGKPRQLGASDFTAISGN